MPVEIPRDKWNGQVRTVVLGATVAEGGTRTHTVTVGGQKTMPFMHFEEQMPHPPVVAIEIQNYRPGFLPDQDEPNYMNIVSKEDQNRRPGDWSRILLEAWGEAMNAPGTWAKQAEDLGADLIVLNLSLTDAVGETLTADKAVAATREVLDATGLPVIVQGPGQAELDNELLVAISEACAGERLALGICEDKNYRTIVATAMANNHVITARTPMDVNLAKQLNILITDMGLPLDRVLMDPTTGALGYGIEYGYSVMERLRMAALQGDTMTQLPMIVTPGFEAWKTKESKVGQDMPASWGEWPERSVMWETLTAMTLLESGADIIVLRHPESLKNIQSAIRDLTTVPAPA